MELARSGLTIRRRIKPLPVASMGESEERLTELFPKRSAPAIRADGAYRTLGKTISKKSQIQLWRSPSRVIAQRFGPETAFFALDIDSGSEYCNREAVGQIRAALEDIGISGIIHCQSSHSEGLHLYAPLPEKMPSFALARTIKGCLEDAGFAIAPGALEIFPNVKQWADPGFIPPKGEYSGLPDYAALRLPCQPGTGFLVLDEWLEPIGESLDLFLHYWDEAALEQDMEALEKAIAHYRDAEMVWACLQDEAAMFHGDVRSRESEGIPSAGGIDGDVLEILGKDCHSNAYQDERPSLALMKSHYLALKKRGWQAEDETQAIVKHLSRLTRIFRETTDAQDLASQVKAIAVGLPGFYEYSAHQQDIDRVCLDWAKSTIAQGYYFCGHRTRSIAAKGEATEPKGNPINEARQQKAIDRIQKILKGFVKQGFTFSSKTAITNAVTRAIKCSKTTVLKHWEKLQDLAIKLLSSEPGETASNPEPEQVLASEPGDGTHPPHSKYKHSVFSKSGPGDAFTREVWDPFGEDPPPPENPKPVTLSEFRTFSRDYSQHHEITFPDIATQYAQIPAFLDSVMGEMLRTGYSTYEGILEAIAELRRCEPSVMLTVVHWLKSLPSVPESEQPKPVKPTADEIKAARKMRRRSNFRKRMSFGGMAHA